MSNQGRSTGANDDTSERTYFKQQREALMGDIAVNMEHVLQNINKLNRSLEGIIAVGHEFGQVEGLWSQFENVMAKHEEAKDDNVETAAQSQDAQS